MLVQPEQLFSSLSFNKNTVMMHPISSFMLSLKCCNIVKKTANCRLYYSSINCSLADIMYSVTDWIIIFFRNIPLCHQISQEIKLIWWKFHQNIFKFWMKMRVWLKGMQSGYVLKTYLLFLLTEYADSDLISYTKMCTMTF